MFFDIFLLFSWIFLQSSRCYARSYSRISMKWEYQRKAIVASSIINAQEQRAMGLGHSSIPRCSLKSLKRKQNLKPRVCSFNLLLREIIYMFNGI